MSARTEAIAAYLDRAGWGDAARHPLPGDASTRAYTRLVRGQETAMLMDQPPGAEAAPCPPDASAAERASLGYNALARLAGPDTRAFAAVAAHLSAHGFAAPRLLAADYDAGFLLIEDLGDRLFAREMAGDPALETPLYEAAVDALAALAAIPAPAALGVPFGGGTRALLAYDIEALIAEVLLLPDWFLQGATREYPSPALRADYEALWRAALAPLSEGPRVLTLRDYHAENLIWLPDRAGHARVGLLDFQDALAGHPAYDLVSLLEDARRDVAPALGDAMIARYCAARAAADPAFDEGGFRMAAALLAAQRNAKIIGIFARLWLRDGKPRYPLMHGRMWSYLERDLAHPALSALRRWFDTHIPPDMRLACAAAAQRELNR